MTVRDRAKLVAYRESMSVPVAEVPAGGTAFTADALLPSSEYCFRVRATNDYHGGTTSSWSNIGSRKKSPTALCATII